MNKYLLIFLSLFILLPFISELDMFFASLSYNPQSGWTNNYFFSSVFRFGTYPAYISVLFLGISYLIFKKNTLKYLFTSALLTLIIGPGLIVNVGLKDHWGRPRPAQTKEFGGKYEYKKFYQPSFGEKTPKRSFPSGHASMGFFFFILMHCGRRLKNFSLYGFAVILTWSLGLILSITRIAQGGHYFSDTIASAIIIYFVSLLIEKIVYNLQLKKSSCIL